MASRVVEPTGSFWLVSVFQTQTRCGHLICNALSAAFSLASKLTNLRLSSENSSPENFLSSSPPDTPFEKKATLYEWFFYGFPSGRTLGSFWLVSVFQTQTRCGHLICNAFSAAVYLASKPTNLHLSSENSSPENFLSSSPPRYAIYKKKATLYEWFFYGFPSGRTLGSFW